MSPILVRPVREQLEHDRLIRFLAGKFKKRFDLSFNVGDERTAMVRSGMALHFPDLVLNSPEKGRKLMGVIEVETGESVNHLEAMAQWVPFSRLKAPFHLYIPSGTVDQARRLCEEHRVDVAEIWTYHSIIDEMRVALAYRAPQASAVKARKAPATRIRRKPARPAARAGRKAAKPPAKRRAVAKKMKKTVPSSRRSKPARGAVRGSRRSTPTRGGARKARRSSKRR